MRTLAAFLSAMIASSALMVSTADARLIGLSTRTDGLYEIDPVSGLATFIGASGGNYAGVGLTYLYRELYASDLLLHIPPPEWNVQVAKIDVDGATSVPIGPQDGSLNWPGLASNEALGLLYSIALDQPGQPLKSMTSDGIVSTIGVGTDIDGRGMAFDDSNGILYATNSADESLYTVDIATGVAQRVGTLGLSIDTSHSGLAFDEYNQTLYLNGGIDNANPLIGNLYVVDTNTGQATLIGSNSAEFIDGLAWIADVVRPVPEPNPGLLLLLGLLAIGATHLRKHSSAAEDR